MYVGFRRSTGPDRSTRVLPVARFRNNFIARSPASNDRTPAILTVGTHSLPVSGGLCGERVEPVEPVR